MGRGLNVDMRIPEISVSRNHANITYSNGHFYLQDNASKYGSLVLVQRDFFMNYCQNAIDLQIGRSILSFDFRVKSAF
jgi:hypothetical protein